MIIEKTKESKMKKSDIYYVVLNGMMSKVYYCNKKKLLNNQKAKLTLVDIVVGSIDLMMQELGVSEYVVKQNNKTYLVQV